MQLMKFIILPTFRCHRVWLRLFKRIGSFSEADRAQEKQFWTDRILYVDKPFPLKT